MIDRQQRRYWQEERERRGLVPGRSDFGRTGVMANLDEPRLLVTTLPSDSLWPVLDFDDEVLAGAVLPRQFTGLTANAVSALGEVASTSDSLIRYARGDTAGAKWRAFASIRRDGGVAIGIGSTARFEIRRHADLSGVWAYRLFVIVHCIRAAIQTQARLCETPRTDDLSPFELVVAIPGAGGSVLGGLAQGWEQPEYAFQASVCLEPDPVIRTEVEAWPVDERTQEDLLHKVATRVCGSFGVPEARFLARTGDGAGRLHRQYA